MTDALQPSDTEVALRVLELHRERVETRAKEFGVSVRPDGFIFSRSPIGMEPVRPDFVTKFTQRVANEIGIKLTPKALRHFSATELVTAGVDVRTVAGRLGHADPSMTLRVYSHRRAQRDREAAAILGKTLPSLSTEGHRTNRAAQLPAS
jgi:integrase